MTVFGLDTNLSVLMRASTEMEKLMEVFAAKSGIAMDSLRYLLLRSYFSVKCPVAILTQLNFCSIHHFSNRNEFLLFLMSGNIWTSTAGAGFEGGEATL